MNIRSFEVIVEDLENNPHCLHGPTLIFHKTSGKGHDYYACSASRDHKSCNFHLSVNEKKRVLLKSSNFWKEQQKEIVASINKLKPYKKFLNILNAFKKKSNSAGKNGCKKKIDSGEKIELQIGYCYNCNTLFEKTECSQHEKCNVLVNLTHYQLTHPTSVVIPKTDAKTHAQYFFSESAVRDIFLLLSRLNISKILCIGVPRIHEHVLNNCNTNIQSLLLDFDKNYFNFYSKNQFIWYNMFNNYIFDETQKEILYKFLHSDKIVVLMDPPFGGRVEPLARTLSMLNKTFLEVNKVCEKVTAVYGVGTLITLPTARVYAGEHSNGQRYRRSCYTYFWSPAPLSQKKTLGELKLGTFWFFPYFMEQHVRNSLPDFKMFDYKVNYDNHSSFTEAGNRKRKFGSPVRIFTNIPLSLLDLKGVSGYKFCESCDYWVSSENKHCEKCDGCTSKNGRTYIHCPKCSKCVKPSYKHCDTCARCCLPDHVCGDFQPNQNCYHCHQPGHKKRECSFLYQSKRSGSRPDIPKKKRKII